MNFHHVELFYYVARYGGLTPAAANMPYGVHVTSISRQINELEAELGKRLYERKPFRLTTDGEVLYSFARRFFDRVDSVARRISGQIHELRLAGSSTMVQEYLRPLAGVLERADTHLHCELRPGTEARIRRWLQSEKIDLAIAGEPHHAPGNCVYTPVLSFQPVLLVRPESSVRTVEQLWRQGHPNEALVSPAGHTATSRAFQRFLREKGVHWRPSITVDTITAVPWHVAEGQGIGLGIDLPILHGSHDVRMLPLPEVKPVTIGVLCPKESSPMLATVMATIMRHAQDLWRGMAA